MMPMCEYHNCSNVASFLGPQEHPAYCNEHLALMLTRVSDDALVAEIVRRKAANQDPLEPKPNADFQVENAEIEGLLNEIGGAIGAKMPKGFGFNLLIFSFGKDGSMFYISNAQRADMIKAMKEFIKIQKGKS